MMHTSAQLVIDHHEVTTLGKELIASRLEEFLCALPTQRLWYGIVKAMNTLTLLPRLLTAILSSCIFGFLS